MSVRCCICGDYGVMFRLVRSWRREPIAGVCTRCVKSRGEEDALWLLERAGTVARWRAMGRLFDVVLWPWDKWREWRRRP